MESLNKGLRNLLDREEDEGRQSWIEGDAMVIDCRGCRYVPVPGSDECIGCMVSEMCSLGGVSRIILRTGKDTEVSGESGKAIKEAASLKRWALPSKKNRGKCAKCAVSRESLVELAWKDFPKKNSYEAMTALDSGAANGKDCEECIEKTRKALSQMVRRMDDLLDRLGSP